MVKEKLPNAEAVKEITSRIDGKDYDVTKVEKKNGNVILRYLLQPVVYNKKRHVN